MLNKKNIFILLKKSFLGYLLVKLLRFHVNGLRLINIANKLKTFANLAFLNQLKALKQYISATRFFRYLMLYYF